MAPELGVDEAAAEVADWAAELAREAALEAAPEALEAALEAPDEAELAADELQRTPVPGVSLPDRCWGKRSGKEGTHAEVEAPAAELASDEEPVVAADAEPEAAWPTHEVDEPSWTVTCKQRRDGAGQSREREKRKCGAQAYLGGVGRGTGRVGQAKGDRGASSDVDVPGVRGDVLGRDEGLDDLQKKGAA